MRIETVAIIGKGAVGLLHGSKIAQAIGRERLEYVMDGERYLRHRDEQVLINGEKQNFITIPASQARPVDLIILAVKATGLEEAIDCMGGLVGPETRIISLLNGVTSEEAIAARYGWKHLVLAITQGMEKEFPERVAFRYYNEDTDTVTTVLFKELAQDVRRMVNYLQSTIPDVKGKKICLLSKNSYEYVVDTFGAIMAGCVLVPLNQHKSWDELSYELGLVEAPARRPPA